jgi:cytochrome P450
MPTQLSLPEVDHNFADVAFVRSPWATLEEIRALGPVVYHRSLDAYLVTGYRAAARVLGNARLFTSEPLNDKYAETFWGGSTMQFDDSAFHDEVKGVWSASFRRGDLQRSTSLIAEIVERRVREFVEALVGGGAAETRVPMIRSIPTEVISRLMGLPAEDGERIIGWSDTMSLLRGGQVDTAGDPGAMLRAGIAARVELQEYLAEAVAQRRRAGTGAPEDLTTALVRSEVASRMSDRDLIANLTLLLFAGNETTSNLMTVLLVGLAQYPDQLSVLQRDRSLIGAAIEEAHRWQTPVALKSRFTRDGASVEEVPLPSGAHVMSVQIAANRDPERWESPELFDVSRPYRPHIGFGFGKHACLGLNLSRLEIEIWLNRILDEVPHWTLADPEVEYGTNFWLRAPSSVRIVRTEA